MELNGHTIPGTLRSIRVELSDSEAHRRNQAMKQLTVTTGGSFHTIPVPVPVPVPVASPTPMYMPQMFLYPMNHFVPHSSRVITLKIDNLPSYYNQSDVMNLGNLLGNVYQVTKVAETSAVLVVCVTDDPLAVVEFLNSRVLDRKMGYLQVRTLS